jgi:hypothetical protein
MTTKITDPMILAAGGVFTLEAVSKVRRILDAAGVTDVELHRLEIDAVRKYREQARADTAAAERFLSGGPLPDHACLVDEDGVVTHAESCPYGCRPRSARLVVE